MTVSDKEALLSTFADRTMSLDDDSRPRLHISPQNAQDDYISPRKPRDSKRPIFYGLNLILFLALIPRV